MSPLAYPLLLAHLATLSPAEQQNVCLSPYSLQSAFALVQEGAKGATKDQIAQTLHTADYVSLPDQPSQSEDAVTFEQANSIWINADYASKIKSTFLKANQKRHQAEVTALPFSADAKQQINQWCSQKTHGRIPEAISELSSSDVMELINTLYFKGTWLTSFSPRLTREQDFFTPTLDDDPIRVSMMHNTARFAYGENETCQIVELPFIADYDAGQDQYAMQVILPKEGTTLQQLNQQLADGQALPELSHVKVRLSLPKFEIDYSADLIPTLQGMGLTLPFSDAANFSRISSTPLKISTVTQKTYFKVDEQGAEAAAVTTIGMMLTSAAPRPEKVYEMTVDHPFLVQLINKTHDTILFLSDIYHPNSKQ